MLTFYRESGQLLSNVFYNQELVNSCQHESLRRSDLCSAATVKSDLTNKQTRPVWVLPVSARCSTALETCQVEAQRLYLTFIEVRLIITSHHHLKPSFSTLFSLFLPDTP